MHDVLVLYARPADPAAFDAHYARVHVPLVRAMPSVAEFAWGRVDSPDDDAPYVVARMTFRSAEEATAALSGPEGQAAVADLQRFAQAGVQVLDVPRSPSWP